jgi:hypothetical protein
MAENDETLKELRLIRKVLILSNSDTIEKEISKVATTDDRKKMWVLIDGKSMPRDIAVAIGVTRRAVTYFLENASTAGFIEYTPHSPPKKILDYVPQKWIGLVEVAGSETIVKKEDTMDTNESKEGEVDVQKDQ